MSAAPRIRMAWSPADTSHQGALLMNFMARSLSVRGNELHRLGELDRRVLPALAEVEDVDHVLPGDVGGGIDEDREDGLSGAFIVAPAGVDRAHELVVAGDR